MPFTNGATAFLPTICPVPHKTLVLTFRLQQLYRVLPVIPGCFQRLQGVSLLHDYPSLYTEKGEINQKNRHPEDFRKDVLTAGMVEQ